MFRFLRKHRTFGLVFLGLVMIGLTLFGFGGSTLISSHHDTVMKINGQKIPLIQFERAYNQLMRQQKADTTPQQRQQLQNQALNEIIRQEVFYQESKKYGIKISDQELNMQIAGIPAFQKEGRFDPATYVTVVRQIFGINPPDFEKQHRKDIAGQTLNKLIVSAVQITDAQMQEAFKFRLATETDKQKRKELEKNPELIRQELREREINLVFNDWLNQLNSSLKVNFVSDSFQKRLSNPAQ